MKIKYDKLKQFHSDIFRVIGLDEYSNASVTTGLCETSLRGVDSHGVRLLPHYVNSALHGRKNPKPNFTYKQTFPSIGHLDADNAFGHAAGMKAIEYGISMADEQGIGIVAVSNSSHPGAMASMALKAAREGYLAFAFTHADALVLSHNGTRPYFGTNPLCFAAPRQEKDPYCLDMASSIVPWNRVLMHKQNGTPLQSGVSADKNGVITSDPEKATCLLPAGGYKGYGIASMIEILCGIYTGMDFGRSIPAMFSTPIEKTRNLGQFYMVMRSNGVIDSEQFIDRMQSMTNEVRNEPSVPGQKVLLPGDKEIIEAKKRLRDGIPIDKVTAAKFIELSEKYDISLDFIN
jgi:LDH2 family malate/lactate/ureidoglycolate dehydrogenase